MDLYDLSFFLSTMWIGPFWIAMMIYPEHEKTHQLMQGPWFFIGPILIWYLVSFSDVSGLIGLAKDSMNPSNALQGLADLLGTKAGASAAWASRSWRCRPPSPRRRALTRRWRSPAKRPPPSPCRCGSSMFMLMPLVMTPF